MLLIDKLISIDNSLVIRSTLYAVRQIYRLSCPPMGKGLFCGNWSPLFTIIVMIIKKVNLSNECH